MGSGGLRQGTKYKSGIAGCLWHKGLAAALASVAALPVVTGCSSFATNYSSAPPQPAPAPVASAPSAPPGYPPPNTYRAASAPPAYSPPPAPTTYRAAAAPAYAAPPPPPTSYAGRPPPPADPDYPETGVYPSVSLVDLFRGSTDSTSAASARPMPHPPATYTPEGQPYPAPVASAGASGAPPSAAAPAQDDNPTAGVYPSESLTDLFRGSTNPR